MKVFDTFLRPPKLRTLFFIFQNFLFFTEIQGFKNYPTSARKIFGIVKKRRVPAEKCSYRSIKKVNMFKANILIEMVGTRYKVPQTGALITSADNS